MGGGADGGLDVLPRVVAQLGEVAALGAGDLRERADVELAGVGAGGRAGPEPVAAAEGLVRRQAAGDRSGDAQAGCAAAAGRAQKLAEPAWVAQVVAVIVPAEPGDPSQRLAGRGRETFLPVLFLLAGVQGDRGGVVQGAGELEQFQVVGVGEAADVVQVVLAGDRDNCAGQRTRRQRAGPVGEAGQPGRVGGHRMLLARRVADSAA